MFTFGIFTTHFPYLIFGVFYAYFFIFGIEKATDGEIDFGGPKFKTEIHSNDLLSESGQEKHFYFDYKTDFHPQQKFENMVFRWKFKYLSLNSSENWNHHFSQTIFSRPPPIIA